MGANARAAETATAADEPLGALMARVGARLAGDPAYLSDWFAKRVAAAPDALLALEGEARWTYGQVDALANRIARAGRAAGLKRGDVAACLLDNSVRLLAMLVGLSRIGVSFSLINPALPARALSHAVAAVPPDIVFLNGQAAAALAGERLPPCVRLERSDSDEFARWIAPHDGRPLTPAESSPATPDDTLFYIFTSGTTGLPKAARCSHRRYIGSATSESCILEMAPGDRAYVVLPMFHIAALSLTGAAISAGATYVLREKFSASAFWDEVRRTGVTHFQYLGEIGRYLVAQPPRANDREHSLRAMIGAGLQTQTWRAFLDRFGPVRIVECYGSSEGVCNLINLEGRIGSVGREAPGENRLRIVRFDVDSGLPARDGQGRLIDCAADEAGELLGALSESFTFEGYSSAEATETRLIEEPGHGDGAGKGRRWFRTGDLFRRDAEGFYYFVDRVGDTFRWKGENVSTQEVATALMEFPGLVQAAAYGVRVPGHEGRAGMAMIELWPGGEFAPAAFARHLRDRLAAHAVPLFVRVGHGAELTATYKMRTAELQKQGYDPAAVAGQLYVLQGEHYVPLTSASLARAGLPAFESET